MRELPITFTTDMLRMILTCARCGKISVPFPCEFCGSEEFVKTQTRRAITPQPFKDCDSAIFDPADGMWRFKGGGIVKPKYQPGDMLWVRETFQYYDVVRDEDGFKDCEWGDGCYIAYKIDCPDDAANEECGWRSSRFMPKRAARNWLKVLGAWAERVQEISMLDVMAEGIDVDRCCNGDGCACRGMPLNDPILEFQNLWDSINAKRGYGWAENPWNWAIQFQRTRKE